MTERLALLLRNATYNLRGGFLVRPLAIALVLGCAGALLSSLEETVPALSSLPPLALFPSHADPQVAQIILGDIATSIMTVVSIVFAILLMTLTLASMQFSPRIIVSFVQDRVTQWTLGIFLGTFLYCMAALPAARALPHPFAPVFTVMGALLLSIACVAWLLFFIHHISRAISVNHIVDRIAVDTVATIDEIMPSPRLHDAPVSPAVSSGRWNIPILSRKSGYIRFIDAERLLGVAKSYGVRVEVLRRVGHFIPEGVPLLAVSEDDRLSDQQGAELVDAFDLGPSRTLQQDVEFGVLQIVDIALKAISPAVNDPTTAISCVDQLTRIMIRFASRNLPDETLRNPPGAVIIKWIGFDRLLQSAFEQIRLYAKSDVAVSLRLLRALSDIAVTTHDPANRRALAECGRRVVAGCVENLAGQEVGALRDRLRSLEDLAAAGASRTKIVMQTGPDAES